MPECHGGESYQLDLIAMPDDRGVPPHVRLKQVLKTLMRTHRFRCTAVRETTKYPFGKPPTFAQDGPEGEKPAEAPPAPDDAA